MTGRGRGNILVRRAAVAFSLLLLLSPTSWYPDRRSRFSLYFLHQFLCLFTSFIHEIMLAESLEQSLVCMRAQ